MLTAHRTVAFLVLAATFGAAILAGVAYYRRREPRGLVTHLLALAQTLLVAQVGLGLLLLSDHRRAPQRLHYLYGSLALVAVLAPWLYAPTDRRRRLAWFPGATLVAGARAVPADMTGTGRRGSSHAFTRPSVGSSSSSLSSRSSSRSSSRRRWPRL